jgi:tetratricopeptide (TPR) repeat protein
VKALPSIALVLVLSACATAPAPAPKPGFDASAAVANVRTAGRATEAELDVRPLADPGVRDLREQAAMHEAAGRIDAAAAALDAALAVTPGDPALLQERAEVALLQARWPEALDFARRSHDAGPKVGPLCRRQQELQAQVALAQALQGDATAAARADAARAAREACTVTPAPRY